MNNATIKKYFSFFIALGVAYLLSSFSIKNLFLADSPRVRPNLDTYFIAKINNTKENIQARLRFNIKLPNFNLAQNNYQPSTNTSANNNFNTSNDRHAKMNYLKTVLKPITKGVNAASKDGYSYTEFKLDEIEWVEITYTLSSGQIVNIRYPKGTSPPPQAIYENQYE